MDVEAIIIIGTGIAAYTFAREFRKKDSVSALILISEDDGSSYPKPVLSNALSKGKTADQIAMFDAETMAEKLAAEIITNTHVDSIDAMQHQLTLSTGQVLQYKKCVLAVGAEPLSLPIKGDCSNEILSINDLADYTVFRQQLNNAKKVAIVGPGLIGCEFANDLIDAGYDVSIIGPNPQLMMGLLPERVATELAEKLTECGVEIHLNTVAKVINTASVGYSLTLENGDTIHADLVVSAIGLRSRTALARSAGLDVSRGVITDKYLQTSDQDIYALGDCAEIAGHNLLYIAPITAAAKSLANTLSGIKTAVKYPAMPVTIKTPCYPLVVAAPARDVSGQWRIETNESASGQKALFENDSNQLLGFVLSGDYVAEKRNLTAQIANLL